MQTIYESASHFYREHEVFLGTHYPGFSLKRMLFDIEDVLRAEGRSFSPQANLDSSAVDGYFRHLKTGAPTEYFTGLSHFYGHGFYVDENVLIPRQETELLVEMILPHIREGSTVVDVGTGSGNIAIAIAIECKKSVRLVVVDRSRKALGVAKKNIFLNGFKIPQETRWQFVESDRLEYFDGRADIVVSNPPYLKKKADSNLVHRQVIEYEPWEALFLDDEEYLDWYGVLFSQVHHKLSTGGIFLMEGHESYLEGLRSMAEEAGFKGVDILRDLARKKRFFKGKTVVEKLIIKGGIPLEGEVRVSKAKNAYLPILAAVLLNKNEIVLKDVPDLRDIRTMFSLMEDLGVKISRLQGRNFVFDASRIVSFEAAYEFVKTMRASVCVLGPLLARFGQAKVSFPGGCAIGIRPIDLHIENLKKMGATITIEGGSVEVVADALRPVVLTLDFPSVGATENLVMASVFTEGETVIQNAALEPEIGDLADFLNCMGADVAGIGTGTITVRGVKELKGCEYNAIGDRIEAATYVMAALATGGRVDVRGFSPKYLDYVIEKLQAMGAELKVGTDGIAVAPSRLWAIKIETRPYPGFPTDLQAQMMALCLKAQGQSVITETIFENRFMHVSELQRLGANIALEGRTALIEQAPVLKGAPVMCTDLRASAALLIAGLMSSGTTEILRIYHLERGYENFFGKLKNLGAHIEKVATGTLSDH